MEGSRNKKFLDKLGVNNAGEAVRKVLFDPTDLTDFEKNVFDLKMLGLEYKEIASMLGKSYKSIDSALQRIRLKVKKALEENKNN